MVAGCGANCMKYLLFFFNFIFFLAGLGIGAMGVILKIWSEPLKVVMSVVHHLGLNLENQNLFDPATVATGVAIAFIVIGLLLVVICFSGCCGACKEVKCLLATYAVLIGLVIIASLAVIIALFVYRNKIENLVEESNENIRDKVRKYKGDASTSSTDDYFQRNKCCGADSYMDFEKYAMDWEDRSTDTVPNSCCKETEDGSLVNPNCPQNPSSTNSFIDKPCVQPGVFVGGLAVGFNSIIGFLFGLVAIEVIGLILAVCLIRMIGEPRAVPV